MKVGVIGAAGRMGSEACRAVESDPELTLVARIGRDDPLDELASAGVEVAIEFTNPASVRTNVEWCIDHGVHCVVGTTGLGDDDLAALADRAGGAGVNVIVAPNFALGAVLMMRFAAQAAAHFDNAEIVERHHEHKLDAPSGTALRTAAQMNEARGKPWRASETKSESPPGVRGGDAGGIRIHSLRVPGSVAHQEVILGSAGETLTIRHDSLDRSSFMPGVVLAVKSVSRLPGVTVGLERVLGI